MKGEIMEEDKENIYLIEGARMVKVFADMLNDVLLVAGMYREDYPFDEDHRAKQDELFERAHCLMGLTMQKLGKQVGWLVPTQRNLEDYKAVDEVTG
jgi:hypothetical protein